MKKLIPLILLIFVSSGFGATHTINSLPYSFNGDDMTSGQADTLVLGSSHMHASGSGISLDAVYGDGLRDVVLLLGTDTISFGESGGDVTYGVRTTGTGSYYPTNIKIVGGYILHNPSTGSANNNRCLDIRGGHILIENVNAVIRGYNGIALLSKGPYVWNNEISGGRYRSEVTGFDSRCDFDAPVIKINHIDDDILQSKGSEYHYNIHDIVIDGGPHVGILIYGESGGLATVKIHDNQVQTDMRNDFYPTNSGICYSAANAYGISLTAVKDGTEIYNNTVTSGTEYGGNRGIYLGTARGTASRPILVYGNYVDVHEGPGVEMGDNNPAHGLRIRYGPGYIDVFNNTFICTGDSDPGTSSYGIGVHPVRLSTGSSATRVTIRDNIIEARSLSSSGVECNGVTFDGIDYPGTYFLKNNVVRSASTIYKFGEIGTQSIGHTGVSIVGDTVSFLSQRVDPRTYYLGHLGNNWLCGQNTALDVVYQGGAAYDDIEFSNDGDALRNITVQKSINLTVVGRNSLVVTGANVTVRDNSSQVLAGTSDNTGKFSGAVDFYYESKAPTNTTNYNNFVIHVDKSGDSWDTTLTVSANTPNMIVTLANIDGDGGQVDQGPTLNPIGSKTVDEGQLLTFTVSATDDYDTPSLTASPLPSGASFVDHNNGTGTFSWTPGTTQEGTYDVTFTAADSQPVQDAETVRITVNDLGGGPDLTGPEAISDLIGDAGTGSGNIDLAWTATGDDGGFGTAAYYVIKWYSEPITEQNWASIADIASDPPTPDAAGAPQTMTISGLEPNVFRYLAIKVYDEAGNVSPLSNVASCYSSISIVTGGEELISAKMVPDDGAVVSALRPSLSAQNIAVQGQNFYYFDVATDSNFFNTVVSSPPVSESNSNFTDWRVSKPLSRDLFYFWRVRVNNYEYSDFQVFSVSSKVYAYPNPVNFIDGQLVSFNLPNKSANLLIQSVSGETVLLAPSISGTWSWDGRNASGNMVSVGVYSWFLQGTKYNGKIVVKK